MNSKINTDDFSRKHWLICCTPLRSKCSKDEKVLTRSHRICLFCFTHHIHCWRLTFTIFPIRFSATYEKKNMKRERNEKINNSSLRRLIFFASLIWISSSQYIFRFVVQCSLVKSILHLPLLCLSVSLCIWNFAWIVAIHVEFLFLHCV